MKMTLLMMGMAACIPAYAAPPNDYYKMLKGRLAGQAICRYEMDWRSRVTTTSRTTVDKVKVLKGRNLHRLVVVGQVARDRSNGGSTLYQLGDCKPHPLGLQ